MKLIWDYVGNVIVDDVVAKYDVKVVYSLLLQVYLHLNPMKTKIEPTIIEDDDCFLWAIFCCWWCLHVDNEKWIANLLMIMCKTNRNH